MENQLLSALPRDEYEALLPGLQPVTFPVGQVIHDCDEQLDRVYFPTTSVISLLYTTEDGATAETGLVGNDGLVGIAVLLGGNTLPGRATVQIAGNALMMRAKTLQEEFARRVPLRLLLLRYTQAFLTQVSQTAVCNRLHSVEKRLCRRLLFCQDRTQSDELAMTQEFIASMLGGRRESVTVAAGHLQDAGLIRYCRGRIWIVDRRGLEGAACECYHIVKSECERLLGTVKKHAPAMTGSAGYVTGNVTFS